MSLQPSRKVNIHFGALCTIIGVGSIGWLVASFLYGRVAQGIVQGMISNAGVEFFKVVFTTCTIGVAVNLYLKHALGETPTAALAKSGINDIYPSRFKAIEKLLNVVEDKQVRNIYIAGFSLRDFLAGSGGPGTLRSVWLAICQRLEREEQSGVAPANRLTVKVLLLDPKSAEGRFRHLVEEKTIGETGLPSDVPHGIKEIASRQQAIYSGKATQYIDVRLYEHCPFAFLFLTNKHAFVEQYYYRDHKRQVSLPLICYLSESHQYGEFMHSIEVTWRKAIDANKYIERVGTAIPIEESGLINIYRRKDRIQLGDQQIEALKGVETGGEVNILSITGRFYMNYPAMSEALRRVCSHAKVRFALINPVSQQAILRAIADSAPAVNIKKTLEVWDWEMHRSSRLYIDLDQTVRDIMQWASEGCSFELHLYSCATSFSLFMPSNGPFFIEYYVYGRSRKFEQGRVLGGEFPAFEFDPSVRSNKDDDYIEREVIQSAFDVVWNSYSIPIDENYKEKEKERFDRNIETLLIDLHGSTSGSEVHEGRGATVTQ